MIQKPWNIFSRFFLCLLPIETKGSVHLNELLSSSGDPQTKYLEVKSCIKKMNSVMTAWFMDPLRVAT